MKVICINNQNLIEGGTPLLTVGKIYNVIKVIRESNESDYKLGIAPDELYQIVDNIGNTSQYMSSRFKMLRDSNLDKLGI